MRTAELTEAEREQFEKSLTEGQAEAVERFIEAIITVRREFGYNLEQMQVLLYLLSNKLPD